MLQNGIQKRRDTHAAQKLFTLALPRKLERQRDEARDELAAINNALGYDGEWGDGKKLSEAVVILKEQRDSARILRDAYHRKACDIADQRDREIAQRDELLEALGALIHTRADWTIRQARAAIAKVKGSK